MSNTIAPERVLEYIEISSALAEKAAEYVSTKEAQDQKIAKLIPNAVKALLENERILPHEKEAAEEILNDPVKVLEILIKTAQHRNSEEQNKLGKADSHEKKASYDSLSDNYVGRRSRPGETESYKALKRGLGL